MKKLFLISLLIGCFISMQAENNWKARWITSERCQSLPNTWLAYRKVVNLDHAPKNLKAKIAADSKYWLWINGQMVVYEGGLKRGPSPSSTYYDVVNISHYLKQGENTIALLLWHFGKNGFSHANSGTAAMIFEAIGEGIEILSDNTWSCNVYDAYQNTDEPHPNYRLPESNIRFDARKEMAGWNQPGFKGRMAKADRISGEGKDPFGELVERPIPMWKNYDMREYVSTYQSGDTLFCRLPYNGQFSPYLKVDAPAGKVIKMQMDNYEGGSANNIRAEYVTREGVQEYESYGWMNGHEMRYIIPKGVKVISLKYRETGYDSSFSGSFECNDPFFNELWKRAARTLYVTMRDTYMDCPDRERAQWWGDEVNELGESFYALSPSSHKLALKGIYELMNWQRPDGTLFAPCPAGNWSAELPQQILASVGWYGFYTQYFYSGDSSFVATVYDRLHKYLHQVWQVDEKGLTVFRSGDWSWGDWGENIDMMVLQDCWYYLALKAERAFALQLGKQTDAAEIEQMMHRIESSFDPKYWNGTAYRNPEYNGETDDRAQAMAVVSGLASPDKYPALTKVLKKEYHASPYMEKYVLEALFKMDQATFALERIKDRYSKMISYEDYTTLFEGWDIGPNGFGGGTSNHAWSGGPLTILSQKVCGIEPTMPGFRCFKVSPQMGSLTTATATVDTNYGKIHVSLQRSGKTIRMKLTVPEGTTAIIPINKKKNQTFNPGNHTIIIKV